MTEASGKNIHRQRRLAAANTTSANMNCALNIQPSQASKKAWEKCTGVYDRQVSDHTGHARLLCTWLCSHRLVRVATLRQFTTTLKSPGGFNLLLVICIYWYQIKTVRCRCCLFWQCNLMLWTLWTVVQQPKTAAYVPTVPVKTCVVSYQGSRLNLEPPQWRSKMRSCLVNNPYSPSSEACYNAVLIRQVVQCIVLDTPECVVIRISEFKSKDVKDAESLSL